MGVFMHNDAQSNTIVTGTPPPGQYAGRIKVSTPHFQVADDALSLTRWHLKPCTCGPSVGWRYRDSG